MCKAVSSSAFDIYRQLRIVNPSPYLFFFELDGFEVVGASPEMLVRFEPRQRRLITHPIAGTRRRGDSDEADRQLAEVTLLPHRCRRLHHICCSLSTRCIHYPICLLFNLHLVCQALRPHSCFPHTRSHRSFQFF